MEEARANSMRVHFGPGKMEPTDHEIFQFMRVKMGLNAAGLMSMYKDPREHCVIIKFKTEEQLKGALLRLPSSMDFDYSKYESTKVTFSAASAVFRYVRIFNLPPEIEDKEISTVLSKYGIIQRMVREKYGPETGYPIWTSVRGVHMEIKHDIPATIHVRNFQARVFYEGLQNKCFVCGSMEHLKVNCPKRSNINQRLVQNDETDTTGSPKPDTTEQAGPSGANQTKPEASSSSGSSNPLFSDMAAGRWSGRPTPKPKVVEKNGMVVLNKTKPEKEKNIKEGGSSTTIAETGENPMEVDANAVREAEQLKDIPAGDQLSGSLSKAEVDDDLSSGSEAMEEDREEEFQTVKDRKRARRSRKVNAESSSDGSIESERVKVVTGVTKGIGESQSVLTRGRSKLIVLNNGGTASDIKNIEANSKDK